MCRMGNTRLLPLKIIRQTTSTALNVLVCMCFYQVNVIFRMRLLLLGIFKIKPTSLEYKLAFKVEFLWWLLLVFSALRLKRTGLNHRHFLHLVPVTPPLPCPPRCSGLSLTSRHCSAFPTGLEHIRPQLLPSLSLHPLTLTSELHP